MYVLYFTVPCRWLKLRTASDSDEDFDCVPYMRYGHSASAIGDLVYIFGGRNDTFGACNTLFCFNTGTGLHCLFLGVEGGASSVHSCFHSCTKRKFCWSCSIILFLFSIQLQSITKEKRKLHVSIYFSLFFYLPTVPTYLSVCLSIIYLSIYLSIYL